MLGGFPAPLPLHVDVNLIDVDIGFRRRVTVGAGVQPVNYPDSNYQHFSSPRVRIVKLHTSKGLNVLDFVNMATSPDPTWCAKMSLRVNLHR